MNSIREIQNLNKREIENNVSIEGSWHNDYRDTAYVYIGGLPFELTEGDIITIFSQFGEPTYLNLLRDKESGKSRGFAFLKYEDQRSTDLAVDNLGGATLMGRILKVDHTRYKRKDGEEEEEREEMLRTAEKQAGNGVLPDSSEDEKGAARRPLLKEEVELQKLIKDHDEDDPMKDYLIKEKEDEVAKALKVLRAEEGKHGHRRHHHRHHSKRSRSRNGGVEENRHRHKHHRQRRRSRSS